MRLLWLLGIVVLASGCIDGISGCVPPISAREVQDDAASNVGDGESPYTVYVLDALDGEPLQNASVMFQWNRDELDKDDPREWEADPIIAYLGARTNEDGLATAHVPSGRYVMASVWKDGFTEESAELGLDPTDILLYPSVWRVAANGSFDAGPLGAPVPRLSDEWHPHETLLANDDLARRTVNLTARLTWTQGDVDLTYVRIGAGSHANEFPDEYHREEDAPRHINVTWSGPDLRNEGPRFVGAWLGPPSSMTEPLEYQLILEANLAGRELEAAQCGVLFAFSPIQEAQSQAQPVLLMAIGLVLGVAALVAALAFVRSRA